VGDLFVDHTWVYDAAFSWDVGPEVEFLLSRLGPEISSVLEPFCGSGRMFPAFARRGVLVGGVDRSPVMLSRARERMEREGFPGPLLLQGDAAEFEFDRKFGGAICPINSFAHLPDPASAARHLETVARHLESGGRYLVQLDLRTPELLALDHPEEQGRWEVDDADGRLAARWYVRAYEAETRTEIHVSRFEYLTGERTGEVFEAEHRMRLWDWAEWSALVAASAFTETAAFDGNSADRPPLPVGPGLDGCPLVWHELSLPRGISQTRPGGFPSGA
jgi:SAM-dependent methyltransferase